MSFKRNMSTQMLKDQALTRSMVGIGILFGGRVERNSNIEDIILSASYHGIVNEDYRVLSMVTMWLEKHSFILNVSRLLKLINEYKKNDLFYRYWIAVSQWLDTDVRFKPLRTVGEKLKRKEIVKGAKFLMGKNGEDQRFKKTCLLVPSKILEGDSWLILSPEKMIDYHSDYKWRVIIGPTFRADMWSCLERDNSLSASQLAKMTYGSYATAHRVKREYNFFKREVS